MTIIKGPHHIGLAVSKLEDSANFFQKFLGFKEVQRKPDYPAIFVANDHIMLTLWQVANPKTAHAFNRKENIGLHHLALNTDSLESLHQLYTTLKANNIEIEFAPEPIGNGPIMHMMCYEPSGIRLELIFVPD